MGIIGATEVKKKLIGMIHLLREIPGLSAYEIAVKNGFRGTEAEWLASLKGEKGDTGTLESHTEVDALGHRVINVAEPVEDTDAVNKVYAEKKADETIDTAISEILNAEDVSEDFCGLVYGCTITYKKVYRCRKLIVGTIVAEEKNGQISFSFDLSVKPKEALTIYGKTFASNGGELNDICTLSYDKGGACWFTEEGGVNASKIVFTFAYPYK